MSDHKFILQPQIWLGKGKIRLNGFEDELEFYTRWKIDPPDKSGIISGMQEIQIKGVSEVLYNQFYFSNVSNKDFVVELENQALGKVQGKGLLDDKIIAWEFRVADVGFDGFEFYEKQKDETYSMRAEYATSDSFRTTITGKVWPKKDDEK